MQHCSFPLIWLKLGAQVPKVYEVELDGDLPAEAEAAFADGRIVLDGAACAPAELRRTGPRAAEVTLMEGKYHQVKRMFAAQARQRTTSFACASPCVVFFC
jgi:16S rRNA pseudouridine516 synthase